MSINTVNQHIYFLLNQSIYLFNFPGVLNTVPALKSLTH